MTHSVYTNNSSLVLGEEFSSMVLVKGQSRNTVPTYHVSMHTMIGYSNLTISVRENHYCMQI